MTETCKGKSFASINVITFYGLLHLINISGINCFSLGDYAFGIEPVASDGRIIDK
jgi:hypothetical protein